MRECKFRSLLRLTGGNTANIDISYRLQEIFGGNAASDEYHIGRHVANLFVTQTYEGQSDIHSEYNPNEDLERYAILIALSGLIIGRAITGLQAFV